MRAVRLYRVDWRIGAPPGFAYVNVVKPGLLFNSTVQGRQVVPVDEWGDYSPGRWLWELDDVRPFRNPPSRARRQGMFNWLPTQEELDAANLLEPIPRSG